MTTILLFRWIEVVRPAAPIWKAILSDQKKKNGFRPTILFNNTTPNTYSRLKGTCIWSKM